MAQNQVTGTVKRPFGFRDLLGYFMGDFGCNMSFTLISSYMFIFISIPFASLKAQNEMKIVAPSAYIIVFFPCRVVVHYKSRRSE